MVNIKPWRDKIMKKELSLNYLFFTRFFIYLLALCFPLFHPSIAVSYDTFGGLFWFLIIPGEMIIAYFFAPPRLAFKYWLLLSTSFTAVLVLIVVGFNWDALMFLLGGLTSFLLTALVFKTGGRGRLLASAELFFLGLVYYKLLSFSRASEAAAFKSHSLTQVILIVSICAFCLHAMVLYLSAFQQIIHKKSRKELLLFFTLSIPVILLIVLALPPNFVTHNIILNKLEEEPQPEPLPLDDDWRSLLDNRGRPGSTEGDKDGKNGKGQLEGVPSDKWSNMQQKSKGKQYAVMIVVTKAETVYTADAYYGDFDAEKGFILTKDFVLNDIKYQRLIETWKIEPGQLVDGKREPTDIFYLSTKPERYLAYQPQSIEPTIYNQKTHPFLYSYHTVSGLSRATAEDWYQIRGLGEQEKIAFAGYLTLPLHEETGRVLKAYVSTILEGESGYYAKVLKLMQSFESFQYQLGFKDDITVGAVEKFLTLTKTGDCSEFSNSLALMARLAGIPARVVTGYLASWGMQNASHRRGIYMLQKKLDYLKAYPAEELLLVTTAHRHSWTQLYLPGYGWTDFESTQFAIPPQAGGDANDWDVVIPLIQEHASDSPYQFPWWIIARFMVVVSVAVVASLYLFRIGKRTYLGILAGRNNSRALKALYRLLLMRLAEDGYILKIPSQTAIEYARAYSNTFAKTPAPDSASADTAASATASAAADAVVEANLYPELQQFALLYTQMRYKNEQPAEQQALWINIRLTYKKAVQRYKKPGILNALLRIFRLRGLGY
jgi:transglutaminase-like putative cysteine protease